MLTLMVYRYFIRKLLRFFPVVTMPPQKEELSDRSIRAGKNLANGSPGEEVVITGTKNGTFLLSITLIFFRFIGPFPRI